MKLFFCLVCLSLWTPIFATPLVGCSTILLGKEILDIVQSGTQLVELNSSGRVMYWSVDRSASLRPSTELRPGLIEEVHLLEAGVLAGDASRAILVSEKEIWLYELPSALLLGHTGVTYEGTASSVCFSADASFFFLATTMGEAYVFELSPSGKFSLHSKHQLESVAKSSHFVGDRLVKCTTSQGVLALSF